MKVVQIFKNGDMHELECKFTKKNILKTLIGNSKSTGNEYLKMLYTWNIGNTELICYGWYDGEAGFENKHDLPPSGSSLFIETDSSEQLLFGDIFIVKTCKGKYSQLTMADYSDYYNQLFGGFDECNLSDDESLSEEEEDDDYKTEDEELSEEEEEDLSENDNELDEDSTEY